MGEIIFSICVGGFLALSGLIMIIVLRREEKKLDQEERGTPPAGDGRGGK